MSDRYDEYRRRAADATEHADKAKDSETRTGWLNLAEQWLFLIPRAFRTGAQQQPQPKDDKK